MIYDTDHLERKFYMHSKMAVLFLQGMMSNSSYLGEHTPLWDLLLKIEVSWLICYAGNRSKNCRVYIVKILEIENKKRQSCLFSYH